MIDSNSRQSYDLFISHAWRFHDAWTKMVELLDNQPGILWRNFSVPWHDPAMDPNTESGSKYVLKNLETQIIPTDIMILLEDVYSIKSARKWIEMEIGFAKNHNVPILAVLGETSSIGFEDGIADKTVNWNVTEIFDEFEALLGHKIQID